MADQPDPKKNNRDALSEAQRRRIEADFDLEATIVDEPAVATKPTVKPAAKAPVMTGVPKLASAPLLQDDNSTDRPPVVDSSQATPIQKASEKPVGLLMDEALSQEAETAPLPGQLNPPTTPDMSANGTRSAIKTSVAASPPIKDDEGSRPVAKPKRRNAFARHKVLFSLLALLVVIGGLAAIPFTRFYLAALVVKQPYAVTVVDSATNRPVSSATVTIGGQQTVTDKDGKATLRDVRVGKQQLVVHKKYFKDATSQIVVPIYGGKGASRMSLVATGRQVPVTVVNKLTGKPLENASLKAVGTEVKTNAGGKAIIVLPADKPTLEVSLTASGFNSQTARITVTDQDDKTNDFSLVPAGRVYFLSGQSGKLDVVKANLDGSDRQTAVYGTGREDDRSTVLLASRDWKFLALYSKRDSDPAKLYLIDTATDKLTPIDTGNAQFQLVGWSGHDFAFMTIRNGVKDWEANRTAIKSYNADKKQLLTLDQNQGEGDATANKFQSFTNPYLINDKVVYGVEWFSYMGSDLSDKTDAIRSVTVGSQAKKDLRVFPAVQYNAFQAKVYEPGGLYYGVYSVVDNKYKFFEYEKDQVKDADVDQDKFFSNEYPTYLTSPDGSKTFWSEQRDGRETFFVGDANGQNAKKITELADSQVYGWYGNDYLLSSKKGSELYIMPLSGEPVLKLADYHKPQLTYRGYGGGYGGL